MNTENLHKLIKRYIDKYDFLIAEPQNELFKWETAYKFNKIWNDPQSAALTADQLFKMARKEMSVLVDGSMVTPASGIIKMAEQEPAKVTDLFRNVLYVEDGGDLSLRQKHMDVFLQEIDKVRAQYYPQSFKYKQDRHAVSSYLALLHPEKDYIYRYTDVNEFAKRIEFGFDIGSGSNFRLDWYYNMCNTIVEALREYPEFLEKHFAILKTAPDKYYFDESLHLMAYDLMYCCRTYNLFDGIDYATKPRAVVDPDMSERYQQLLEENRRQIQEIKPRIEEIETISLIGVSVQHRQYGTGTVTEHSGNIVAVRFENTEKRFVIHKRYPGLPIFEDNERVVEVFTEYEGLQRRLHQLLSEQKRLEETKQK